MLERIPIRVRLSMGHALWMALIFVGIGIGVSRVVEDSILQSLDSTLLTSAKTIRDAQLSQKQKLSAFHDPHYWESMVDEFFGGQRYIKAYAQLVETSGKVRARTSNIRVNLPVTPLALSRAERGLESYESFSVTSGGSLRQLTLPVMEYGKFTGELIQVGASMSASMSTVSSVQMMLWMTLTLGFVVSLVFGYLLTKWSFMPVARITREVGSIGFTDSFDRRLKLPAAEDELRLLVQTFNEMLVRIEDAFGRLRRFAGDVSHELRTPIAVLRGEAELALRRERTPAEYQESLHTIVGESAQMSVIVEDLLLLARAHGQAIPVLLEEIEISKLVSEVRHSVQKNFEEKQVILDVDLAGYAESKAQMASSYFILAIKNILLNACKHSSPGQTVSLCVLQSATEWQFKVSDHGEGIPQESLPYIFDLFYRAETARNRSTGGAGIGLSLAKALVAIHGGRIEVASPIGEGASFTITLPHRLNSAGTERPQHLVQRLRKTFAWSRIRRQFFPK